MTQIARLKDPEISNGNVINADDLDSELNQLVNESNSQDTRLTTVESGTFTQSGTLTTSNNLVTNGITERTAASGVTIDSVLCKDGFVKTAPTTQPYVPVNNGEIGLDTTNNKYMVRINGVNQYLIHDGNVAASALPSQTSNSGKYLTTNGTAASWGAVVYTLSYTSSDQTVTAAGALTLAHSLGVAPKTVYLELICQTGELGYTAGDVVRLAGDTAGGNQGVSVVTDATNIVLRYGSATSAFFLTRKDTGVGAGITNGNWKLRVKGFA